MNILFAIALTTGILSGIWGWVAVALGLLSWAGFLGCTAYFACPQGGLKGLAISSCTVMSGVVWALVIIHGSALAPQLQILSYMMTGIVAFCGEVIVYAWMDRRRENSEKPYGTRLRAGLAVSARLVGKCDFLEIYALTSALLWIVSVSS